MSVHVVEVFEGEIAHDAPPLVRQLVRQGHRVDVICPPGSVALFENVAAEVTPLAVGSGVAALAGLRRVLRAHPTTVVHAHGLRAGVAVSLARAGGTPFVLTLSEPVPAVGAAALVGKAVTRAVFPAAATVLAPTTELVAVAVGLGARDVRLFAPVPPEPAAVIRGPEQVREELALSADRPIVLAQARLHPESRLDVLVDAAAHWRRQAEVVLVGTGPAYRDLVARAIVARAPVTFAGDRVAGPPVADRTGAAEQTTPEKSAPQASPDVASLTDLLAASTVAVVTDPRARPEFALRAAQAGVALVLSQGGVLAGLFGEPAEGVVTVPTGDATALDEAVQALLSADAARADLAAAARVRLASLPDLAGAAEVLAGVYGHALTSPEETADTPGRPR